MILYPVQNAPHLLAYETRLIEGQEVLKVGSGLLVLTCVVIYIVLPRSPFLDLPPV